MKADLPLEIIIQSSLGPGSNGAGDGQVIIANPSLEVIGDICDRLELYVDTTCFGCDVEACDRCYHRVYLMEVSRPWQISLASSEGTGCAQDVWGGLTSSAKFACRKQLFSM